MKQNNPFTNFNSLFEFLSLDSYLQNKILINPKFPLLLPYRLAKKIKKNTLNDPILRQFVPFKEERKIHKDFTLDPLCESQIINNKYLQKYKSRALLFCSSACSMNCRFCFRKNITLPLKKGFDDEIKTIENNNNLDEVILSGGDPLSLSNQELKNLLFSLNEIKHLKKIRFHSRYIIAYPQRIDDDFLKILTSINKKIVFVLHINHANEIDQDIIYSINKLQNLDILVLNQSVLLKDINDNFTTLKNLSDLLLDNNIIFYYLHQLDKAHGTKHFEVDVKKGKKLINLMLENLSGYTVPKYVQELNGKKSKWPL